MHVRKTILVLLAAAVSVTTGEKVLNTAFDSSAHAHVSDATSAQEIERISVDELKAMIERNQPVTIIDTRSEAQYNAGHIRGAIRAPLNALEAGMADVPRGREIIAYCA